MTHNLDSKTLQEIESIVNEYRLADSTLNRLQAEVERIDAERALAVKKIEDARNRESRIIKGLSRKFGEGYLDPMTMKYITKTEKHEHTNVAN